LTAGALVANCIPPVTTAIDVLLPTAAAYPKRLVGLGMAHDLHVRGALGGDEPAVAIVGARAASARGMERAHALAKHLAGAGVRVVSGGALGIDGAAHRGALDGNGATTVVLGSGIDVLYPERHARMFHQIARSGGALVSMFRPGAQPRRYSFLKRNALISALSDLVVVVEAEAKSGSMSTARAAIEQKRIVAAMPGSAGCDRLIASGAALVESYEDALAALAGTPRLQAPPPLDEDADAVRAAIQSGARTIDSVVALTGLSVRAVLRALPHVESYPTRLQ